MAHSLDSLSSQRERIRQRLHSEQRKARSFSRAPFLSSLRGNHSAASLGWLLLEATAVVSVDGASRGQKTATMQGHLDGEREELGLVL